MKIDTHQHFWNLHKVEYPWLTPDYGPLYRTYEPPELEPQLKAAGIDRTVLVQSANSYADTDSMLAQAARYPNVYAKVSGLNAAANWDTWSAADLRPYIDAAIDQFGADRLMFGSDWPVCVLAGDYARGWAETNPALEGRPRAQNHSHLRGGAPCLYNNS